MGGRYSGDSQTFTPKMVPGLVLWLDAQDPSANGVLPANAAQIATWVDKSNRGNNATQGTSGQQPTYSIGSLVNGVTKNAVQFTRASSQRMGVARNSFPTGSGARTQFIVFTTTDTAAYEPLLALGNFGGSAGWIMVVGGNHVNTFYVDGVGVDVVANTTTAVANTTYLFEVNYPAGGGFNSSTIFINGVSQSISGSASVANTTYGGSMIGSQEDGTTPYLSGVLGEVIMYNVALTTPNQTAVRTYLRNKYGI